MKVAALPTLLRLPVSRRRHEKWIDFLEQRIRILDKALKDTTAEWYEARARVAELRQDGTRHTPPSTDPRCRLCITHVASGEVLCSPCRDYIDRLSGGR